MEAAVEVLDTVPRGLEEDAKSYSPSALHRGLPLGICVALFWDCLAEMAMVLRSQRDEC